MPSAILPRRQPGRAAELSGEGALVAVGSVRVEEARLQRLGHVAAEDLRPTLFSGLLPLAVLMCFIAMKYAGVDANVVALSGIAIAIGTMVDMGVVICENILSHIRDDDTRATLRAELRDGDAGLRVGIGARREGGHGRGPAPRQVGRAADAQGFSAAGGRFRACRARGVRLSAAIV